MSKFTYRKKQKPETMSREDVLIEIWADDLLRLTSRQLWLWVVYSRKNKYFNMSKIGQCDRLGLGIEPATPGDLRRIRAGARQIVEWGFFRYHAGRRRYYRRMRPGETNADFVRRVQRSAHLEAKTAVLWALTEMTWKHGIAPQSVAQLADNLNRDRNTVRVALKAILAEGHFRRSDAGRGRGDRYHYLRRGVDVSTPETSPLGYSIFTLGNDHLGDQRDWERRRQEERAR